MKTQEFDFDIDVMRALLWQHNQAPALHSLLGQKQAWYDANHGQFWNDWVRDVFDLRTANRFGLTLWSIILGIPLTVTLPPSPTTKKNWGFGTNNKNFGHGNFGSLGSTSAGLTVAQARLLLRLRYFQLICRPTVPETNRILASVFKEYGRVYVLDDNAMHMRYVFTFAIPSTISFVLNNFDVLPRPAAVELEYLILTRPSFGFGPYNKNFNNGTFSA